MKKRQKMLLGCIGLAAVVGMTGVALVIPDRNASAVATITDTIKVRVVGSVPDVEISGIIDDAVYINPERVFSVTYENVEFLTVTLEYTNMNDEVRLEVLDESNPDYMPGVEDYEIDFVKE